MAARLRCNEKCIGRREMCGAPVLGDHCAATQNTSLNFQRTVFKPSLSELRPKREAALRRFLFFQSAPESQPLLQGAPVFPSSGCCDGAAAGSVQTQSSCSLWPAGLFGISLPLIWHKWPLPARAGPAERLPSEEGKPAGIHRRVD